MVKCQSCGSTRLMNISAKCSDCCVISLANQDVEENGYVPSDSGVGGGDYIDFQYCLECGQIQCDFPLDKTSLESKAEEEPEFESEEV